MEKILLLLEGTFGALIMVSAGLLSQLVMLVAVVWMTVAAGRQSLPWALFVFIVPLIGPCLFAYNFWTEARTSFYMYLGGLGLLLAAVITFILRAFISIYFGEPMSEPVFNP
jgi:hypothetical protein